jgi:pseudouridine-5'-phosphate glycosidase
MPNDVIRAGLDIGPEVADALATGRPVVALESTIICHGMPYPANVETAREVAAAVRSEGAVPATVALIDGCPRVGLDERDIDMLGREGRHIAKVSRRDLPFIVLRREHGATTVAATMIVAARAGIRVFATGGIGGVHRGGESSMDISADLDELARTDVAVVCAGIKSVLDLPRTLEYLETSGVPVVGFGTNTLPAFYTRDSGLPVDYRVDSAGEIAAAMHAKWQLELDGGIVVAVPIPAESSMDPAEIDAIIEESLAAMKREGIGGKAATPYLLDRIAKQTAGRSLAANIALVVNNARVAARIAAEYNSRQDERSGGDAGG